MAGNTTGIGARLRAGRESLSLTVLQAAEKLHVDPRILESLESEDFAALGAPVYARGHLRHYAELVGESVSQLNELLSSTDMEGPPDLTRIAKAPPTSDSNKLIVPALFVLAVFAVAGAVWWVLSLAPQPMTTNDMSVSPSSTGEVSQSSAQSARSAASPGAAAPAAGTSQARTGIPPTHLASAAGPGVAGLAAAPPTAAGAGVAPGTAPPEAAAAAQTAAHPGREQQITLRYSADSWTEVYDATGQRLFYDVGGAGSMRTLKGTAPLRVVLANAAGVSVEVGGRETSIAKLSQPDGSAEFLVNRSGRLARARSAPAGD